MRNGERWPQISDILARALDLPESDREAYIEQASEREPALRTELLALFQELRTPNAFLETPPAVDAAGPDEASGAGFGAYRILRTIGEGGMGVVYLAERSDGQFTRQVAIKRIGSLAPRPELLRRFRDEREILARLDHPNIARLLDAGVDSLAAPYLVMEYVDGAPVMAWCKDRPLSVRGRLDLFLKICAAVQHAHQNVVIHRDIKPGNILVTPDGEPKLLDFGIAKILGDERREATGTMNRALSLDYASPEQVRGETLTTATDVYSLGVLLYELLTDMRPHNVGGKSLTDAVRAVCEDTPVPPSRVAPAERRPLLAGDLDAIASKAMEKAAADRYASVAELAADIRAHLDDRPVKAQRVSSVYVARKFVRRHRAGTAIAVGIAVLLATGVAAVIRQSRIAERERARAERRFQDVRELAGALIFRIHDEVAPLPGSTPVRKTVIAEGLKFLERLERDAADDPALQLELARAYLRIGNVQGGLSRANLGNREAGLESFRRGRDLVAPLAASAGASWDVVKTLIDANLALAYGTDRNEVLAASTAALETAARWARREPDSVRTKELLASANTQMALASRFAEASLPNLLEANRLYDLLLGAEPSSAARMRTAALSKKYLGRHFDEAGDHARSLEYFRRAHDLDRKRADAEPGNRQIDNDLAIDLAGIGEAYWRLGRHAPAIEAFRESLEIRQRIAAADPQNAFARGRVAFSYHMLARLQLSAGEIREAERHSAAAVSINDALSRRDRIYRAEHAASLHTQAEVQRRNGRAREACAGDTAARRIFALVEEHDLNSDQRASRSAVEQALEGCRTSGK